MKILAILRTHWLAFVKGFILLGPVILSLWLINRHFFLTKTLSFFARPGRESSQLNLANDDLVASLGSDGTLHWRLNDDKLRISVKIPRSFTEARLQLNLENVSQRAVVVSAQDRPGMTIPPILVDDEFLNRLAWPHITNGALTLWQRGENAEQQNSSAGEKSSTRLAALKQYTNIEEFLSHPPPYDQIGVLNLDPNELIRIENYRAKKDRIILSHSFRGGHKLLVYVQDEDLDISFDKVDLNRSAGPDPMTVTVSRAGREVYKKVIADDGIAGSVSKEGPGAPVHILIPDMTAGVYEVLLDTTDDVLIKNISTPQRYFTFEGHIFLADGPEYRAGEGFNPVTFSVAGNKFVLETPHAAGLQTVTVGKDHYRLQKTKTPLTITSVPNNFMNTLTRGDVNIIANSIALAPAQRFSNTSIMVLPFASDVSVDHLNYIIAAYQPRETFGPIYIDNNFLSSDLFVKSKTITFTLSAPNLVSDRAILELKDARVTLTRAPIPWKKIPQKIIDGLRHILK